MILSGYLICAKSYFSNAICCFLVLQKDHLIEYGKVVFLLDNITYRDAGIEDLPIIVDIYNSAIPGRMATADTEFISVNDRLDWFKEHNPKKRPLWVVEYEGEICGWISFESFYGRPAYNETVEEVKDLGIGL